MKLNTSSCLVALLLIGVVVSEKVVEKEKSVENVVPEASKESSPPAQPEPEPEAEEPTGSENLIAESRTIDQGNELPPTFNKQGLKQANIMPVYPVYRHTQDMQAAAATNYRGPRPGPQFQVNAPRYQHVNPISRVQNQVPQAQLQSQAQQQVQPAQPQNVQYQPQAVPAPEQAPPKKEVNMKKPIHKPKPQYYPKESSYSSIPQQPIPNTPRFIPDPSRNQAIETISPAQMQNLGLHPQPFPMMQHGVQMPHFAAGPMGPHHGPGPHGPGPHGPGPFMHPMQFGNHHPHHNREMETATVKYEQTEHGFMDRMWGEVMSVRRTMSDNIFIGIPNLFRRFWDSVVGAVSATSRMFTGADSSETLNEFSARMSDWVPFGVSIFESILKNLSYS